MKTDILTFILLDWRSSMTYGYIRVSTDKQTVENQKFEITNFCRQKKLSVDGWIEETISGTRNYDKRKRKPVAFFHLLTTLLLIYYSFQIPKK